VLSPLPASEGPDELPPELLLDPPPLPDELLLPLLDELPPPLPDELPLPLPEELPLPDELPLPLPDELPLPEELPLVPDELLLPPLLLDEPPPLLDPPLPLELPDPEPPPELLALASPLLELSSLDDEHPARSSAPRPAADTVRRMRAGAPIRARGCRLIVKSFADMRRPPMKCRQCGLYISGFTQVAHQKEGLGTVVGQLARHPMV